MRCWTVQCSHGVVVQHVPDWKHQRCQLVLVHLQRRLQRQRIWQHPRLYPYEACTGRATVARLEPSLHTVIFEMSVANSGAPGHAECTANKYSLSGDLSCRTCPTGSSSAAGASTCACLGGYASSGTDTTLTCTRTRTGLTILGTQFGAAD